MEDKINQPKHYTYGKFECIDVIKEITNELKGSQAFCLGNTVKYLWRFQHKNGVEDLKKARWYLDKLISEFENTDEEKGIKSIDEVKNNFLESNQVYNEMSDYLGNVNHIKCVNTIPPKDWKGGRKAPKPVYQLDNNGKIIKKYHSIHSAQRDHMNGGVGYAVRHGTKCNGYYWKYAEE